MVCREKVLEINYWAIILSSFKLAGLLKFLSPLQAPQCERSTYVSSKEVRFFLPMQSSIQSLLHIRDSDVQFSLDMYRIYSVTVMLRHCSPSSPKLG